MSRFPIAYTSHALSQDRTDVQISYCLHVTCTAPGQDICPDFLLPTRHMYCPRTGQMSRFPIAYTSHALPQDRTDVQISYCLHITCTAPGQDICPDFLLPTRHMYCPRTGQMSRFPIAYTSHALPQDRTDVQISYCLHVTCTAPGQDRCPDFLLPTHHMHYPRTGQMSRFPIAYTSHALPQDRADVQISYCLHITCTATGQGKCPCRFPIAYKSHAPRHFSLQKILMASIFFAN